MDSHAHLTLSALAERELKNQTYSSSLETTQLNSTRICSICNALWLCNISETHSSTSHLHPHDTFPHFKLPRGKNPSTAYLILSCLLWAQKALGVGFWQNEHTHPLSVQLSSPAQCWSLTTWSHTSLEAATKQYFNITCPAPAWAGNVSWMLVLPEAWL